jgi:hypothetical protein
MLYANFGWPGWHWGSRFTAWTTSMDPGATLNATAVMIRRAITSVILHLGTVRVIQVGSQWSYWWRQSMYWMAGWANVTSNCTEPTDECDGVVCENGGTCVDSHLNFTCVCRDGFFGGLCESSFCDNVTCRNGGRCVGFGECSCPQGYSGDFCEVAPLKSVSAQRKQSKLFFYSSLSSFQKKDMVSSFDFHSALA